MEKYKICPCCGERNASTFLECLFCETDLTGVPIQDQEAEITTQPASPAQMGHEEEFVRVCEECGTVNRVADRKCAGCGEDISDIIPTARTAAEADPGLQYILSSVDGSYAFEITQPQTLIGRECEMKEYLGTKVFVSRKHAEISLQDGKLAISNLSGTNYTFVNNVRVAEDHHPLCDGDEIGLGGCVINGQRQENAAYFVVRIGGCM